VSITAMAGDQPEGGAQVVSHTIDGAKLDETTADAVGRAQIGYEPGALVSVEYPGVITDVTADLTILTAPLTDGMTLVGPEHDDTPAIIVGGLQMKPKPIQADGFDIQLGCTTVHVTQMPAVVDVGARCMGSDTMLDVLITATQGGTPVGYAAGRVRMIDGMAELDPPAWETAYDMLPVTVMHDGAVVTWALVVDGLPFTSNLGEVPKESYKSKGPLTRMGVAALVRKAFSDADAYRSRLASGGREAPDGEKKNQGTHVPRSPKHEALIPALEVKVPVYFSAHRADDISTALRIAAEFKLKPVIALATEAYRMTDELKKAGVPVVVHPTMQRAAANMETLHGFVGNAAILANKQIPIVIGTGYEGYVPKTRVLRHEAAMAAANGLGSERALKAVTIDAAKLLGIEAKYGTIEKGKIADLVLYDGDPFEHATHVTLTLMKGETVFSRADYLKLPFERRILSFLGSGNGAGCCLGVW